VGCLVSLVGSIKYYRFSARKSGAAPEIALNVLKDMPVLFLSRKQACTPALPELSLGRKNGIVRPIGHINTYRYTSRNPRARPIFERARARNAISSPALGSSRRRAGPVRIKPLPREWRSSPDRAHQDLSMCIEKPTRAPYFRARAPQKCDFITCTRKFMPACPPCPN
jgi:hypothetical protein